MVLAPPPPAKRLDWPNAQVVTVGSQLSFHTVSGMYPRAEVNPAPLVAFQNVESLPFSLNWVPPMAVLNGVEANPLTAMPADAGPKLGISQPAAPLSPADTRTVIPCAAACCQRLLKNAFSAAPRKASQAPKLTVIMGARLLSIMYADERSTPSVVAVEALTTTSIFAFGAIAPAHSVSSEASTESPEPLKPGSGPSTIIVGSFAGRPKMLRKICTSV